MPLREMRQSTRKCLSHWAILIPYQEVNMGQFRIGADQSFAYVQFGFLCFFNTISSRYLVYIAFLLALHPKSMQN